MADSDSDTATSVADLPTDRLKGAVQTLLSTVAERAANMALERVDSLTGRLTDVADNGGVGLKSALAGGKEAAEGGNPVTGAIKGGLSAAKDKVMGAVGLGGDDQGSGDGGGSGGSGGGGRGKFKFMNIVEELDVGVPVRVAYDQWTQFADFPTFMKKVSNVDQEADEKQNWQAQVFWSKRSWTATIIEQIPDTHIIWKSQGAKGYVNGIVSFHELTPNLTKVLLVLEYYPVGFFEKTGNIWRAVGRRARLEFKHYRRHVMVESLVNQEDLEGWRGEIRDSEVVKTHEEALEEERAAEEDEEGSEEGSDYADNEYADEYGDEYDEDGWAEDDTEDDTEREYDERDDTEEPLDEDADADRAEDTDYPEDAEDLDEPDDVEQEDREPTDEAADEEAADEDADAGEAPGGDGDRGGTRTTRARRRQPSGA
ncbi:SRPBCC family protein [Pseudonocardia nantongensis]|uniref:SRPBCC family protein n=1 Tax=Pseudonocardia nantongensis TaxID=1181885 RepID=UPI00397B5871